ncbi:MAG: hypothetical protein AB1779_02960, partial [Candidatus Thermoplasmatota archaeon]
MFKNYRRMLKIFWVVVISANLFVIAFSLSNIYILALGSINVIVPKSAQDFAYRFDSHNETIWFSTNFTIINNGTYDIDKINFYLNLKTKELKSIFSYKTEELSVPKFTKRKFQIELPLSIRKFNESGFAHLITEDSYIYIYTFAEAYYCAGLVRFYTKNLYNYSWKAPLKDIEASLIDKKVEYLDEENFRVKLNYTLKHSGWGEVDNVTAITTLKSEKLGLLSQPYNSTISISKKEYKGEVVFLISGLGKVRYLVTNNDTLSVNTTIEFMSIRIEKSFEYNWGAPLYNFNFTAKLSNKIANVSYSFINYGEQNFTLKSEAKVSYEYKINNETRYKV